MLKMYRETVKQITRPLLRSQISHDDVEMKIYTLYNPIEFLVRLIDFLFSFLYTLPTILSMLLNFCRTEVSRIFRRIEYHIAHLSVGF